MFIATVTVVSALIGFLAANGNDYRALTTAEFGIKVNQHAKYPRLFQFTYDMVNSPANHPVVVECRGAILEQPINCNDNAARWRFIARPFDRFFNVAEGHCAIKPDEVVNCQVAEKLDGSLCVLYHYDNQWHFATKGRVDAGGNVDSAGVFAADGQAFSGTFAELAEKAHPMFRLWLRGNMPENVTLLFELTAPENRIVIPYTERKLTWLAARNRDTGVYFTRDDMERYADRMGVQCVKTYPAADLEALTARINAAAGIDHEGVVLISADGQRRAKLKNTSYVAIHHAKDNVNSLRALVTIVSKGETSEAAAYFPHVKQAIERVQSAWDVWCQCASDQYADTLRVVTTAHGPRPPIGDRNDKTFGAWMKSFAARAKLFAPDLRAYMFTAVRDPSSTPMSPAEFLRQSTLDFAIDALGLKAQVDANGANSSDGEDN